MMVVNAIQAGLGVGRSADWMLHDLLARNALVEILPDWQRDAPGQGGLPMFLVFQPGLNSQVSLKIQAVADFLEGIVQQEFTKPS